MAPLTGAAGAVSVISNSASDRLGCAPIRKLERLGVARVSFGSAPMRASMAVTRRIAAELLSRGTYTTLLRDTIPGAEMNQMLATWGRSRARKTKR